MKTEHGKSMLKCKKCDDVFDNKFNLEQHLLNVHQNEKKYECEQCKALFLSKWRFKKHREMHVKSFIRTCHFFNNNLTCPFELNGCKFAHVTAEKCKHYDNL